MGGRERFDGRRGTPQARSGRRPLVSAVCWLLALAIHLVWVPNLIWLAALPARAATVVVDVAPVGLVPIQPMPPDEGQALVPPRQPEAPLLSLTPRDGTGARTPLLKEREGARPGPAGPLRARGLASPEAAGGPGLSGQQRPPTSAEQALALDPEAHRSGDVDPSRSEGLLAAAGPIDGRDGQGARFGTSGPDGGGQGLGARGAGQGSSPLLSSYRRDCIERIYRHWSYPPELAYDLQQGLVLLEVQIRHDGRVERVTVQRSSGFEAFDQTAIRAVRLANPLAPPPPEELFRRGRNFVVLSFSMRYRNPMFE